MTSRSDVSRVISAESFKLRRQRTSVVLPVLVVAVAVLMYFGLELAARRDWLGLPSGFFLAASVVGWIGSTIVVLVVIVTAFSISQEFAIGTVKAAWVRPIDRSAWYQGKIVASCAINSFLFLCAVVVAVLLSYFRFGFTNLMEKEYLVHSAGELGTGLALAIALTLWTIWAATVVAAAISALFAHPGGAIACGFGLGLVMTILAVFPPLRPFLLTTYVGLPSDQMVAMSKGLALPLEWKELVWHTLAAGGAWMLGAYFLGQRIIGGKEVKT